LLEHRDADKALGLAIALSSYWETRGNFQEARHWLEKTIESYQASGSRSGQSRLEAKALSVYATLLRDLSEFELGLQNAEKSLELWTALNDDHGTAAALETIGSIALLREDYARARTVLADALDLLKQVGDRVMIGRVVHSLGRVAIAERKWTEAEVWISESLTVHEALGSRALVASALNNLGLVARYRGNLPLAREMLQKALIAQYEVGDRPRMAITRLNIGTINRLDGRFAEAREALETATAEALDIGERRVQAWCIKELGHLVIAASDRYETGLRLLASAEAWREVIGMSFNPAGPEEIARDRAKAEVVLGLESALRIWNVGSELTIEEAYNEAIEALATLNPTKGPSKEK